jgi:hypothetical protein
MIGKSGIGFLSDAQENWLKAFAKTRCELVLRKAALVAATTAEPEPVK